MTEPKDIKQLNETITPITNLTAGEVAECLRGLQAVLAMAGVTSLCQHTIDEIGVVRRKLIVALAAQHGSLMVTVDDSGHTYVQPLAVPDPKEVRKEVDQIIEQLFGHGKGKPKLDS